MAKNNINVGSAQDLVNDISPGYSPNPAYVRSNQRQEQPGVLTRLKNTLRPPIPRAKLNLQQYETRMKGNRVMLSARQGVGRQMQGVQVRAGRVIQNTKQGVIERFNRGYQPPYHRKQPIQPAIRQEVGATITRAISGRSAPRADSKGYGSRGRPKGTYKYYIPGVGPAGVFEWRKYQRFRQRQLAMQMQQENPNMNYPQALSAIKQVQVSQPIQISQPQQIMQPQGYNQQIQPQQIPMQQGYAPQQSQPFDDGWGLLRIKSPFSMTGANNGLAAQPVDPLANAQAPVGNRNTAYYSEPSFFGTNQVMRERPNIGGFGLW